MSRIEELNDANIRVVYNDAGDIESLIDDKGRALNIPLVSKGVTGMVTFSAGNPLDILHVGRAVRLAFIGDSISSGTSDTTQTGYTSYVKQLGGDAVSLVRRSAENWAFSTPGYSTQQIIDAGYHVLAAQTDATHVCIFAGANDFPSTQAEEDATVSRIIQMAQPSISAKKRIVLIPPMQRRHATTSDQRIRYANVARRVSQYAIDNRHLLVDVHAASVDRASGSMRQDITPDGVHPTEAWHWYIASRIISVLGIVPSRGFSEVESGAASENPCLQNFTAGVAAGWTLNYATGSTHNNDQSRGGVSQLATVTSGGHVQAYRTDTDRAYVAGQKLRMSVVFEVLSDSNCESFYIAMANWKNSGGSEGSSMIGAEEPPAGQVGSYYLPVGEYHLDAEMTVTDTGNLFLVASAKCAKIVIHYCGARVVS